MIAPQAHWLPDGRRLHLQQGPIDLILAADGTRAEVQRAYEAAVKAFDGLLARLVEELPRLRSACPTEGLHLTGPVAQRMEVSVRPLAGRGHFITPMAAVAGAVAEEILAAMVSAAALDRAYVNNGGDIAYYLSQGESYRVALAQQDEETPLGQELGRFTLQASDPWRGVATSGRGGRSLSLGIAECVTVLARTAARADAAATLIANAVDLPGDPAITRQAACDIAPDSDLGERLVVTACAWLPSVAVEQALSAGLSLAEDLQQAGLIEKAVLSLQGQMLATTTARPAVKAQDGLLATVALEQEPIFHRQETRERKVTAHA
ncbi:UPF0280 family protein [Rhodovibrionaceae bacterium A322]